MAEDMGDTFMGGRERLSGHGGRKILEGKKKQTEEQYSEQNYIL